MTAGNATTLVHLVGFVAGVVLYAMLATMTVRTDDRIPFVTAVLGLVWNSVALVIYGLHDFGLPAPIPHAWPWIVALAFSAVGFLPAVVVHSAVQSAGRRPGASLLIRAAYAVSTTAAIIQLIDAGRHTTLPSRTALYILTIGYAVLIVAVALYSRRQPGWRRALTAVALAAFAVMALHLSQHTPGSDNWATELVGHHASLPLALVILYQDYRFAFADLFLKRALTLVALLSLIVALYAFLAAPLILPHLPQPGAVAALLSLWTITALAYPRLRTALHGVVDRLILRRVDYRRLRDSVAARVEPLNTEPEILDDVCETLSGALTATRVTWSASSPTESFATAVRVPTTDAPIYTITISGLAAGRRLLSDDFAMLDGVALIVARRLDAVRVSQERYGRDLREREILQLATQAQLTALRAQLNPHFLFNALTTIGHLMEAAPHRALETLFQLTSLLRAVLTRSDVAHATLGDEIDIVRAYLSIERARFEERLAVTIDVPSPLLAFPLPPLLIQPLVENAIKHGISPRKLGGSVMVTARATDDDLRITVTDTGVGATPGDLARGRASGIGLANINSRLAHYYGAAATLTIRSTPGLGTTIEISVPVATPALVTR
jgi:two-component system, LytTR family, sensor kinase